MFAGVPEAIKALNDGGLKVVIITNQSGVARGYFTEEMLARIHGKMLDDLKKAGAKIDSIYYCPHHPDDNCECRKPRTALFQRAGRELNIDFGCSYMVGDMAQDIVAGRAAGCKTVFVTNGGKSQAWSDGFVPDAITGTFGEAAKWILADVQGEEGLCRV